MSTFINDQISLEITLIYVVEIKYLECIVIFSNKITSLLLGAQKCNKIKTNVKAGTDYPYGAPEFPPGSVVFVWLNLSFSVSYFVNHCPLTFDLRLLQTFLTHSPSFLEENMLFNSISGKSKLNL